MKNTQVKSSIIFITLWLFLMLVQQAVFAASARVTGMYVVKNDNGVGFAIDLTTHPQYQVFFVAGPPRVVIDLQNTLLAASVNRSSLANTPIKNVRTGVHENGQLRIVLDLQKGMAFRYKLFGDKKGEKSYLLVNLGEAKPVLSKAAIAATNKPSLSQPQKQVQAQVQAQPQTLVSKQLQAKTSAQMQIKAQPKLQSQVQPQTMPQVLPSIAIAKPYSVSLLEPDANQKPRDVVIVIDPGHGGKDPGASGVAGAKEKNVVLAIAKDTQRFMNQRNGFSVILTRDGDYHVGLRERLRIAHVNKADVFISLHADIYKNKLAKGASVYALSSDGATSEAARWLAERENASELGAIAVQSGNALRSVLLDVAQTASIKNSLVIADNILQQLSTVNKLHSKKIDQASFVVLKAPDIPSLLIETGFISDPKEEKNLSNPEYQEKFSEALAKGLVNYFSNNPPPGTYLALEKKNA